MDGLCGLQVVAVMFGGFLTTQDCLVLSEIGQIYPTHALKLKLPSIQDGYMKGVSDLVSLLRLNMKFYTVLFTVLGP
jgi:hypothetical protein